MKLSKFKSVRDDINSSTIELFGNKRIIIFDCKSIVDYSDCFIILDLGSKKLKITGTGLVADSFVFGQTDITGEIYGVEFM